MKIELQEVRELFSNREELKSNGSLLITESVSRTLLKPGKYQGTFSHFNKEVYPVKKEGSEFSEVINLKAVFLIEGQQIYIDVIESTVDFIESIETGTLCTINVVVNNYTKKDGSKGSNNIGTLVPVLVTNPLTK